MCSTAMSSLTTWRRIRRMSLPSPAGAFSRTFLTLITLDVLSNQPNPVTFAPIYFYNESLSTVSTTNPLWEFPISTAVHFICYGQFALSTYRRQPDAGIHGRAEGSLRGRPGDASRGAIRRAGGGQATLLGLVHTIEGTEANAIWSAATYTPLITTASLSRPSSSGFRPSIPLPLPVMMARRQLPKPA